MPLQHAPEITERKDLQTYNITSLLTSHAHSILTQSDAFVIRSDFPLDILPGEVPGLSVEDAVALRQPPIDMGLVLIQQKRFLHLGAQNLVLVQRGLGLLCLHLQKELTVSCHHALISSLHLECLRALCQKMPPIKLFPRHTTYKSVFPIWIVHLTLTYVLQNSIILTK